MDSSAPCMPDPLPEPLVPADVDLRSYDWFPFKHKQLTRSGWWMRASDQAKALNMELWCAAYEEVPAASLPDDDIALSDLVGFGRRDLAAWRAVKAEVMAPWVLCSDGRWYHPTLAEVAVEAWKSKQEAAAAREADRERKRQRKSGGTAPDFPDPSAGKQDLSGGTPTDVQRSASGNPAENALKGHDMTGQEKGEADASPPDAQPRAGGEGVGFAEVLALYGDLVVRGRGAPRLAEAAFDALDPSDQRALPSAIRAFAAAKPWGSNGPPGLQRFIGDGVWREFAPAASVTSIVWAGPADLRAAVAAEMGEPFTRSYLDPATWQAAARTPTVVALTGAAAARLRPVVALKGVAIQDPVLPVAVPNRRSA